MPTVSIKRDISGKGRKEASLFVRDEAQNPGVCNDDKYRTGRNRRGIGIRESEQVTPERYRREDEEG
ncbi:MAG: hypothetical protein HGA72_09695 [Chlorobiaceae bacterium]|nr:hypothetical protein [Chlorobiaceae bacterium]NTW17627.1 hypothetical protein [Syntrophaceae bacterium]